MGTIIDNAQISWRSCGWSFTGPSRRLDCNHGQSAGNGSIDRMPPTDASLKIRSLDQSGGHALCLDI